MKAKKPHITHHSGQKPKIMVVAKPDDEPIDPEPDDKEETSTEESAEETSKSEVEHVEIAERELPPPAAEPSAASKKGYSAVGSAPVVAILDEGAFKPESPQAVIPASPMLGIVFLQELNDYPIIGSFNFLTKFGVNRIQKFQTFTVPRDVALALLDKKLVQLTSA